MLKRESRENDEEVIPNLPSDSKRALSHLTNTLCVYVCVCVCTGERYGSCIVFFSFFFWGEEGVEGGRGIYAR